MKQIQPVTVWSNGQEVEVNALNAYVVSDNLLSQAVFYYGIGNVVDILLPASSALVALAAGQLTMTGQAYEDYQTNQYAWDWVAQQLNLTIVGDVTTTTTSSTTTETTTIVP